MTAAATRAAYIARVVSEAPPLRDEQIDLLAVMLHPSIRGAAWSPSREPSPSELERRRKAQEHEDALKAAKKLAESMTACDICDLQPEVHSFQQRHGAGYHEWEPGRAAKITAMKAGTK